MIDYEERLEDLYKHIKEAYLVDDTQAIDILLSTRLLPESGPWIIVETACNDPYPGVDSALWYAAYGDVSSVRIYKEIRPSKGNAALRELLDAPREGRVWIDPAEEEYRPHTNFKIWQRFEQACIRLRTQYRHAVPMDTAEDELKRLMERVLDTRWRGDILPPMDSRLMPKHLAYWLELLQRISKRQKSWGELVTNFRQVYRRLIWLRNKSEGGETEKRALVRLMRDTVPTWTAEILRRMEEGSAYMTLLHMAGVENPKRQSKEVWRLYGQGISYKYYSQTKGDNWSPLYWGIRKEIRENVMKLVRGEIEL